MRKPKEAPRSQLAWTLLLLTGILVGGCKSEDVVGVAPTQQSLTLKARSSFANFSGSCAYGAGDAWSGSTIPWCPYYPVSIFVITSPTFTMWHSIDGTGNFGPNTSAITISFSKLFYRGEAQAQHVAGGVYFFKCGSMGTVTFSGPGGTRVVNFNSIWPNEPVQCEPESDALKFTQVTPEVFSVAGFNAVTIEPPSPLTWDFWCTSIAICGSSFQVPRMATAHGTGIYSISFQDKLFLDPHVTSCFTNDELIDLVPTRQLLDSLWKLAGGDSIPAKKIERGGYLIADSLGVVTYQISNISTMPPDPDNACHALNSIGIPSSGKIIAGVHVHPFHDGDQTTVCHPGTVGWYEGMKHLTFSVDDLDKRLKNDVSNLGPSYQGMIVMDKDNISFAGPVTTSNTVGNFKKPGQGKTWPRQQSPSCKIA